MTNICFNCNTNISNTWYIFEPPDRCPSIILCTKCYKNMEYRICPFCLNLLPFNLIDNDIRNDWSCSDSKKRKCD